MWSVSWMEKDTQGQYTVMEATLPPHVHQRADETFLVLAGQVTFHLDDKTLLLKTGEFIFAPRGIPHYFKNIGAQEAILLETALPAGVERFFEADGKLLATRRDSPSPVSAGDISRMRRIAPEFGITLFLPKQGCFQRKC